MEIQHIQKNIHTTPRKLRLVADLVRKMKPSQALQALKFVNKTAAVPLSKSILTAIANAKQQNLDPEKLIFKRIEVNEGNKLSRHNPQARGRVSPFVKRMSHIKIVLGEK